MNKDYIQRMTPEEAGRGLLETIVRMSMTHSSFKDFTHLRCQDGHWQLLRADDNGVYAEKEIRMGLVAGALAVRAVDPYDVGGASIRRLTITFSPPKLSIDVLDASNNPLVAKHIIDTEMELRLQQELLGKLSKE